jgi:thioredoxin 1
VLLFKNGEVVDKQVGVAQKNVYTDKIDAAL